jgi:hypothetical protein
MLQLLRLGNFVHHFVRFNSIQHTRGKNKRTRRKERNLNLVRIRYVKREVKLGDVNLMVPSSFTSLPKNSGESHVTVYPAPDPISFSHVFVLKPYTI